MSQLSVDYIKEHVDNIDKIFDIINMEYEIDIMKINNNYYIEKKIMSFHNNDFLFESKESSNSGFKNRIKGIFQALIHFIENIISSIKELFNNKHNITADDYIKSSQGKIQLEKDIDKLGKVVNEETKKGNKLLHKIASKVGVSEQEVDNFIKSTNDKIKKIGPKVIIIGGLGMIVKHASYKSVKGITDNLNENMKNLQDSQNIVDNADLDEESKSHFQIISNQIKYMIHLYGNESMKVIKKLLNNGG